MRFGFMPRLLIVAVVLLPNAYAQERQTQLPTAVPRLLRFKGTLQIANHRLQAQSLALRFQFIADNTMKPHCGAKSKTFSQQGW